MITVALTGGIASGKSLVAGRLRELGAIVIDSDALAREVVEPGTEGLARVAAEFGSGVLTPEGALDRRALGAIVFGDPERRRALEAITHPLIRDRAKALAAEAPADAVVVRDIPLLVETAAPLDSFAEVIVVDAPLETRIARMVEQRGMSRQEALDRIAAQATDEARLAIATVVIDNGGTVERTVEQVDALWSRLAAIARSEQPG
ncbi:MAG TPA: dephospho-CoA kinase [Microbacterium sp.]|nr:dephospho-CoA kinase [Microbacterium sp.]